jgi:F-type H+-transporting ATPase subunit b
MSGLPRWFRALALVALLGLPALPAAAAEGGGDPAQSPFGWVLRWVNSALLVGGLIYLLRKAPGFFRRRAQNIASAIEEARRAREDAEARNRDAEGKLARLEEEVAAMRAAARRDSAAEAERIRAAARDEAEKVRRAARLEIAAAERAARLELKAMASRMAVQNAESLVRSQLTPETEAALFRSFVEGLAGGVQ